jgi:hypothetical protein
MIIMPFVCSISPLQRMVLILIWDIKCYENMDMLPVAMILVIPCYSVIPIISVLFTSLPFYLTKAVATV